MNAFVKKEVRLLLPSFIAALALAIPVAFIGVEISSGVSVAFGIASFFLSPALVLMMTLDSFGREISAGTFANLLAQPISRRKIWWTKTLLLALAILLVWTVWWISFINNKEAMAVDVDKLHHLLVTTILFPAVIFSGGLWTVLMLRQVAAAFWFTILIPAALSLFSVSQMNKDPEAAESILVIVLGVYSIAGFVFARWLFLRAQDVQWTGGIIELPQIFARGKSKMDAGVRRKWRPHAALFIKELQLHQSQLVMAGVLVLLHLGVIATRKFGDFKDFPALEFVLSGFWVLWFAMPLIVGCAAVAEERKLGTVECQLCLPARRRTQFWIKFITAFLLSLLLAIAVPLLLEGSRILPEYHPKFLGALSEYFLMKHGGNLTDAIGHSFAFIHFSMPILILIGIASVIAVASFYASTLSRNTLQSLAPAVLGIMVTFALLIGAADAEKLFPFLLWRGWLIYLIGLPVMTLMFLALMYWNFKRVLVGWNVWRCNALMSLVSLTFVIGITTVIYNRAWEFLRPFEPAHGAARLTSPQVVTMESYWDTTTIRLPDGKIWTGGFKPSAPNLKTMLSGNWKMKPLFGGGKYVEVTNWASVAISYPGMVGVQNDGSLWVSEKPRESSKTETAKLVRFGQDNDWKGVSGYYFRAFLLKQDGTLWRLSAKNWDRKKTTWPGTQAFEIQNLGTNSDWAEISKVEEWKTVFRKADGQAWISDLQTSIDAERIKLDEKTTLFRAEQLDRIKSITHTWARYGRSGNLQVGVRDDGRFVVSADFGTRRARSEEQGIQLGKDSDWLAVAGEGETVVTLKADGSLWKWNFPDDPIRKPNSASAVRFSKNSDWIAIADNFGGVTSLAADGSLWFWQFDPRYFMSSDQTIPPLLGASHKPQKIGNVFDLPSVP